MRPSSATPNLSNPAGPAIALIEAEFVKMTTLGWFLDMGGHVSTLEAA